MQKFIKPKSILNVYSPRPSGYTFGQDRNISKDHLLNEDDMASRKGRTAKLNSSQTQDNLGKYLISKTVLGHIVYSI